MYWIQMARQWNQMITNFQCLSEQNSYTIDDSITLTEW